MVRTFIGQLLFKIGAWCFRRIYPYVDILHDGKVVRGVTFTNDRTYIDHLGKFQYDTTARTEHEQ